MDSSIFGRIADRRTQVKKEKFQSKRNKATAVREHEFAHARIAGPFVNEIKFFHRTDVNNIEHVEAGAVFLDTKLVSSNRANIDKLTRLIHASEAPADMSQQDKKLRSHLESQLNQLRRAK